MKNFRIYSVEYFLHSNQGSGPVKGMRCQRFSAASGTCICSQTAVHFDCVPFVKMLLLSILRLRFFSGKFLILENFD